MREQPRDRPGAGREPGEDERSRSPGDPLESRIAAAREAIAKRLREVAGEVEREEEALNADLVERVERIATDRVDEAVAELRTGSEIALERALEAIRSELATAVERALADLREAGTRQRAAERERLALAVDRGKVEVAAAAERALAGIAESERRIAGVEERVSGAGRRIGRALEVAARATDWERRLDSASVAAAEATRRIAAAERRLLDRLDDERRA